MTREAVVSAAQNVDQGGNASLLRDVAGITNTLTEVSIPVGWAGVAPDGFGWWRGHVLGWALTAVLVMVGAPFWFELLERLVSSGRAGPAASRRGPTRTPPPRRLGCWPATRTPRSSRRRSGWSRAAGAAWFSSGTPGEVEVSVPESELLTEHQAGGRGGRAVAPRVAVVVADAQPDGVTVTVHWPRCCPRRRRSDRGTSSPAAWHW